MSIYKLINIVFEEICDIRNGVTDPGLQKVLKKQLKQISITNDNVNSLDKENNEKFWRGYAIKKDSLLTRCFCIIQKKALSNCQTKEFIENLVNIQIACVAVLRTYFNDYINESDHVSRKCNNSESLSVMHELLQSFYVPGDFTQIVMDVYPVQFVNIILEGDDIEEESSAFLKEKISDIIPSDKLLALRKKVIKRFKDEDCYSCTTHSDFVG